MNGPARHDLSYYRGSSVVVSVQYLDSDDSPVNLSGYAASMHVRKRDGTLVASTGGGGITATITAATGTVVFTISDAVGRAMPPGTHVYDVWVVSGGGSDDPLLVGYFRVAPEVRDV